jgi:ferrous iron transport protein A
VPEFILPLESLERGEIAEVAEVTGPLEWRARMAELGLRPAAQLRMLQPGSPCVILLGGARLSLRCGAGQIRVRPIHALCEVA